MAVNTSKVTSAATNGNVEIVPDGSGKVRLTQNAGLNTQPVAVDNLGDVKNLRIKDLTVNPAGDPVGTDEIMIDRTTDNQVRKVTIDKVAATVGGILGDGVSITPQPGTPPATPSSGDLWYNTASEDGRLYIYYGPDSGGTTQWVDTTPSANLGQSGVTAMNFPAGSIGATYQAPNGVLYTWNNTYTAWQGEGGGGASVEVGPTPPASPSQGDMWWNPADDDGTLYIYYGPDPSGTSQWVPASPGGGGGGGGANVEVSDTPPVDATEGDMWWNSSDDSGRLYVYYGPDASGTEQWVDASPTSTGGGGTTVVFAVNGSTLKKGDYAVVSSSGATVNLPASPAGGDSLTIVVAGTFTDTVVARNGSNIMSLAEDITLDKAYAAMVFTYVDAANGWRLN